MDPLTVAESLPSRLPDFVAPHAGLRDAVAALAQEIYSMAMKRPYASTKPAKRPLPSLITEGLDAEQIWEELGLLMKPTLNKASSDVETQAQQVSQVASPSEDESTADDLDDEEEDEDDFDDMDAEEADFHEDDYDEEEDDDEENEEDEEEEEEDDEMEGGSKPKRMLSSADPESEFFSVDDMQKFVDAYDSEPHSNVDEDEDDEDEEDGEGEDGEEDDMANATYERFYGKEQSKPKPKAQPQPKDKEVAAKKQPVPKTKPAKDDGKKKDLFADDQEDDEAEGDKEETSRFGRQIADIRSKIAQLEEENLGPREWALRGEASARDRPANSLVEADMDYDALKLHKRSVTQDVNQSLEALILGRIKARLWNDVERIEDNDDSAVAKALGDGVQDAKSSKSLSQLYEEEYSKTVHGTQDVGNPLHTEIAQLFRTLAYKLDKLTGSATGPRPAIVDVPRPTNVASLTLETTGAPDAPQSALLPPQAVYKPEEDKTRQQRKRAAYKKKKAEQPTSLLGVLEKRAHNAVKKRSAAANASAREGDVTKFGKSAAVFRKLQEQRDDGGSAQVSGSKRGASDDFRGGASAQKKRRVDEYKF